METATTSRVLTEATIENLGDIWENDWGRRAADQIRRITVSDGWVDTRATLLSMPTHLIQALGLERVSTKYVSSTAGSGKVGMYEPVRLTIQGRSCTMDVFEVPDHVPVLIGNIILVHLDLVIDTCERRLIGNPAHGGEHIYELY